MTEGLWAEMEDGLGPADRERATLPRGARRGHHSRRPHRLRRAGGLRDGDRGDAGHGARRLRHRLRDRGPALRRSRASARRPERVRDVLARGDGAGGAGRGLPGRGASPRSASRRSCGAGPRPWGRSRGTAERDRIPVDDGWDIPKDSRAWRGQEQLGSLGGGNHFIELQHDGGAALGHVPHRLARLRPRPRVVLLRAGAGGAGAEARPDGPRLLPAADRGTGATTRTRWPRAGTSPS